MTTQQSLPCETPVVRSPESPSIPAARDIPTPLFGADDLISVYTRAQAINDGVLVDLSALAPDVCRQHVGGIHVACTNSVWSIIDAAIKNPRWANDLNGVVHDILWMAGRAIEHLKRQEVGAFDYFTVIVTGAGRQRNHQFKVGSTIDESERPCLTILLPHED